jgi:hypothetical protein
MVCRYWGWVNALRALPPDALSAHNKLTTQNPTTQRDFALATLRARVQRWAVRLAVEKGLPPLPALGPPPQRPLGAATSDDVSGEVSSAEFVSSAAAEDAAADAAREQSHGGYGAALLTFGSYHLQVCLVNREASRHHTPFKSLKPFTRFF